jgi:hypothetical protein
MLVPWPDVSEGLDVLCVLTGEVSALDAAVVPRSVIDGHHHRVHCSASL